MLRFSGSSQNPGSSVLDELQLSNGLLWKAGEETITIIHPAGDKGMNKFLQVLTGNKTSKQRCISWQHGVSFLRSHAQKFVHKGNVHSKKKRKTLNTDVLISLTLITLYGPKTPIHLWGSWPQNYFIFCLAAVLFFYYLTYDHACVNYLLLALEQ